MTTYSDEHINSCETDPVKCKQYFWACAMNAIRYSKTLRQDAKKLSFVDGQEQIKIADNLERFGNSVLKNLDVLVDRTCKS